MFEVKKKNNFADWLHIDCWFWYECENTLYRVQIILVSIFQFIV